MERSGTTPSFGVEAGELADVAELFELAGPFLSVFLDTEPDMENAAQRFTARWASLRQRLAQRGVPTGLLDQAGERLTAEYASGPAVAVLASAQGRALTVVGHTALGPEVAAWDSLPRVAPLVAWHQSSPPALLVVMDRTGADLITAGHGRVHREEVAGDDSPVIHRSAPGGWSQRRYQQRAENRWRANAGDVARRVGELADELRARLVVVAGDVRAVQLMLDQLPERVAGLVRLVSGGRGEGSEGHLEDEVRRWYRTAVAEDTVALLEAFKEELGQRDRAVAGMADTVASLNAAAVETLLVHDDPSGPRRLFFSPQNPMLVSEDADTLLELGEEYRDGRAVDTLIRAAWTGGAAVRIVTRLPELGEGVGAILRYARQSVPGTSG
ncbi:MAG: hypothetical protein GEV08_12930 [Acidimicrobiia bacterium]|nr:hypothetical protein [Acidimicrobiia bacterium]